jgi:signal transduction histidine kinase
MPGGDELAVTGSPEPIARIPTGTSESGSLLAQIAWFNRLRLIAACGVVAVAAASHLLGVVANPWPLYALAAATVALDLFYVRWFERLAHVPARIVRRHVDLQILLDLLILTALLHWGGGVTNPCVLFYLFHGFIAAMLLPLREALGVAGVSLALVAALGFLERFDVIPHHPIELALFQLRATPPGALTVWWVGLGVTFAITIYFVSTIVRQLRAREEELRTLNRQLGHSEKLASIGTLAAGVSHEINNPVGVIQSKVQILRYRIADGDAGETLLRELDTIEKHVRRIGAITAGLLTFSRETPFERKALDLNALVEESLDLVRTSFKEARVELARRLDPTCPQVLGSANHLLQVLVNLELNARDASSPGTTVTVSTERYETGAVVRVEDRGTGIRPDHLPKIFDPFFTTKDVDKGTGLGLAISHGIVELHRGRIDVETEWGHGTRFTVVLPGPS